MKNDVSVVVSVPEEPGKDPSPVTLPKAVRILKGKGVDISVGKLRRLVKMGKIPSFRMGNRYYVSIRVLLDYFGDASSPLWTK
jgi:hypothetical protein